MPGPLHTWSHLILTATLGCIYYPIFKDEEIETQKKLGNLPEEPQGEGDGVELGIQICQTGNPRLFFCDSIYCSEHWLLFIYILMRYFNFTPLWGKSGTMISEDHLCLASVSLGQLAAFETTSPVKWGQSSPCGNTVMRPKGVIHTKRLAQCKAPKALIILLPLLRCFLRPQGCRLSLPLQVIGKTSKHRF